MSQRIRIGALLSQAGVITPAQLEQGLVEQKRTGQRLGQCLTNLGFITTSKFYQFLSEQLNIPLVDLRHIQIDPTLIRHLPETYARRFRALILEELSVGYKVGLVDPTDITAIDELERVLQSSITLAIVNENDLLSMLDQLYRRTEEIASYAEQLQHDMQPTSISLDELAEANLTEADVPVIRLLRSLFEDALQVSASDIHIEPDAHELRIRQRIDGVLYEQTIKEKAVAAAVALRLKLMADLDIAEKRLPQDGRFSMQVKGRVIDIRISTLPTYYGESVVMRLLDQSNAITHLDNVGMSPAHLQRFRQLIRQPNGLLLVTGPTGSGKTTTLYGALNELNTVAEKIITVEDPIEYRLPRLTQVQVNSKIDLTFTRVLRTALRQDPDIILVGEMRDKETVQIAMRAALTGHLVLSSLHTNDAASSAIRLLDLCDEPYLVASTLRAVVAQRLIRRICPNCKKPHVLTVQEQTWLSSFLKTDIKEVAWQTGEGCLYCHKTGYQGRIGIFELLELNAAMLTALHQGDPAGFFEEAYRQLAGQLLSNQALELAKQGISSLREVMRMSGELM